MIPEWIPLPCPIMTARRVTERRRLESLKTLETLGAGQAFQPVDFQGVADPGATTGDDGATTGDDGATIGDDGATTGDDGVLRRPSRTAAPSFHGMDS